MQIVLICRDEQGSAAFHAGMIEAIPAPARRYEIANYRMTLSGYPGVVLHHDADVLLSTPGGLYRMLTPSEMDKVAEAEREASTVQETAKSSKHKVGNGG